MSDSYNPVCPVCSGQNSTKLPDLIFIKLHSINLEDTTDEVKQREITDIELINQLALPPEPKVASGLGIWRIPLVLFGIYLFLGYCASLFYSTLAFTALAWDENGFTLVTKSESPNIVYLYIIISLLCLLAIISLFSMIFLPGFYFGYISNAGSDIKVKSEAKYPEEKEKWDTAKKLWNELYYCNKDNIIFNPLSQEVINPESTRDYIYGKKIISGYTPAQMVSQDKTNSNKESA